MGEGARSRWPVGRECWAMEAESWKDEQECDPLFLVKVEPL